MARLGDLCRFINGDRGKNYPSQAEISSTGDVPFINAGHIVGGKLDFSDMNYISEEKYNQLNSGKIQENDVLYCLRGSLGKKAIIKGILKGAIASSLVIIRPDSRLINSDYLFYALESPTVQEQMMQANNGSSQPNLSAKSVSDYAFNLPTINEQCEIVSKLAKVSDVIALRKEQLAKLDQLVKSRFIELFGDVKEEDKLINLCNFIDYRGKTPEKAEDGLPFITAKNVKMHHMSFDTQEFISKETYDRVMTRGFPRIGDVVFTTEAPLGNVCRIPYIETEFYIGQRIITMQTEQLESAYLEYALSSDDFKRKITEKSSGSTVTGIRSKLLEQLTIPVPPKVVQKQFTAFVEQTDKSKLAIQQSLDKLETLKKSLMQEYFG